MDKIIYGADTETLHGKPMTFQFYSEDVACDELYFVNEDTAFDTFVRWVKKRRRNVQHVVYVHNLAFDLVEFLWSRHHKLISSAGDFEFNSQRLRFAGVYGSPTFCKITNGHDLSVTIVDSFSYVRSSLDKASQLFCPKLRKLKRPSGIGEKKFTKRDTGFCEYAMRDAEVTYHMGRSIERLHEEFDLRQCVSVADMAATVFRHKYLTYTIPQPSRDVIEASLDSYHGGKNNITCEPGWYEHVNAIDISSAYPHAMASFPSFENAKLYKRYKLASKPKSVPDLGVYCVSGKVAECDWPSIFSHGFAPLSGRIDRVWVQGFELNEALRSGELKPSRISGHYYDAEHDHGTPALRAFVSDFYRRKESEKDKVLRYMYKLILNSISGKFIQTRKRNAVAYTDVDAGITTTASELVAGGMFHPFIASATTAHSRARIHRLEHHYSALHTATDSVFTTRPVVQSSSARDFDLRPSKHAKLGSLSIEAKDATLLVLRNKCYIMYGRKSEKTTPSKVFRGRHIIKSALHGFQGNVTELERLVASNRRKYTATKVNRLKDSLKRGVTPNEFVKRDYTLKVGPLSVQAARRSRR